LLVFFDDDDLVALLLPLLPLLFRADVLPLDFDPLELAAL